ncbi:MAG TPA: thiamine diphosphokinase [Tepidiformaceae bacterium]|nr:thiamine diphosphokinase [Tepidiformaceae bacterium]
MPALVFANGEPPSAAFLVTLRSEPYFVVAADGGARHAIDAGFTIDAVVGDLDSVTDDIRRQLPAGAFHEVSRLDTTDLEKAIRFCIDAGHHEIDVVCAGGGRADHALANLSVLTGFRGNRVRIRDEAFTISLVDGAETIEGPPGTVISLMAIGECTGITTRGLRWDLADFTLSFSPRGVHNEIARSPATVSVDSGDLLLFHGQWVERHR